MRIALRPAALALATILVAAACSAAASPTPAPSVAPSAAPSVAPSTAPSQAPSAAPSAAPSVAPSPSPDACAPGSIATLTPGTLTIGTDNPAYPPYFEPSDPNPAPWELGDPTNGKGFESAVAYAVADRLGFPADKVTWVYVPFTNSYAPGPKTFDFVINQVSWKPERAADRRPLAGLLLRQPVGRRAQGHADRLGDVGRRPEEVQARRDGRHHELRHDRQRRRTRAGAERLRHERRRHRGPQGRPDRRHRRRPPDRVLHDRRPARRRRHRRPVPARPTRRASTSASCSRRTARSRRASTRPSSRCAPTARSRRSSRRGSRTR